MLGKSPIKWRQCPGMTIAVDWDVSIMGTTKHCCIQNIEALGLLVSEKKIIFSFSHC